MTIEALEGLTPEWFTRPGQDKDNDPVTRLRIRPLDGAEYGVVANFLELAGKLVFIRSTGRTLCLQMVLLDWESFSNSDGPVKFSIDNMRLIPHEIRMKIVARIVAISHLDPEQERNSGSPLRSRASRSSSTAQPARRGIATLSANSREHRASTVRPLRS